MNTTEICAQNERGRPHNASLLLFVILVVNFDKNLHVILIYVFFCPIYLRSIEGKIMNYVY